MDGSRSESRPIAFILSVFVPVSPLRIRSGLQFTATVPGHTYPGASASTDRGSQAYGFCHQQHRGLEPTVHAKNPPPTAPTPPSPSPQPQPQPQPPQAGPADSLLEARSPPVVVRGSLREPPAAAAGARSSAPAADGVEALAGSQVPPPDAPAPAPAGPPSRRRNRRNMSEPAAESKVEQPEADDTSRGNKRQMVVHCVFPEWSAGSSVQVKIEYAAGHVVPTAPAALLTCPICLSELEEPSVTTCGHVFCDRCVKQAVRIHKACPNCRKKLCRSSIRRIYLPTSGS